ncbi:hypothetical protein [Streptomyces parvus]|uniref:Uncharacterized protein n=1 Tax=Streptomyces parvus TaxID=66428 RepID=A0A7K3S2Z1_9ACTN|nr:hypothetical protein [Streptomyces parvus]NEC21875.1 hypothetical protein [Streptomyces parvus]
MAGEGQYTPWPTGRGDFYSPDASYRLLLYRDAVVAGHLRDDPECTQARRAFREARQKLMTAMRSSLAPR